ncbi:MAG: hypothetical protein COB16_09795 [Rhodobacteraceae bacterium]|nr:MAG: hypothetical protein COB16_09795 [Paracoccaceae bacterium]
MNKLNDMIANAAKLAVQKPNEGEALNWNGPALSQAVKNWYADAISKTGACVLIDADDYALSLRKPSLSPTTVIWSGRPVPDGYSRPQNWSFSQRMPSDLYATDAAILSEAKAASSMLAIQQALHNRTTGEAWVASDSTQVIIAPFLLNVLDDPLRAMALSEITRVLSVDGCFKTLVLAADETLLDTRLAVEGHDCLAFPRENEIAKILLAAGCHGVTLTSLLDRPYMIVDGVELRAFSVRAYTGTKGICLDQGDAAVYLGPWSEVRDDDGHCYPRGTRIAVCAKTAQILQRPPYVGRFKIIEAYDRPTLEDAVLFDCSQDVIRPVAETKGLAPIGCSAARGSDSNDTDCGC